jgi:glycerol-3-phosphate dehydrogenase
LAPGLEFPELLTELVPGYPYLKAEILWAVREEMALTLRDVLARRLRLEFLDWQACLKAVEPVAKLMAEQLGWTADEKEHYVSEYRRLVDSFQQSAGLGNKKHQSQVEP